MMESIDSATTNNDSLRRHITFSVHFVAKESFQCLAFCIILVIMACGITLFSPFLHAALAKITPIEFGNKSSNFLVYDDPSYNLSMKYPANWEKVKGTVSENIVIFRAPQNVSTPYRSGVGIYVLKLPYNNISLQVYNQFQLESLKKDYSIIKNGTIKIGQLPAYWAIITNKSNDVKALQLWTVKNNKAFVVAYLSDSRNYLTYLPTVQNMLKSFKISDPN